MVFPCLCTTVEVAAIRQGAGKGDCAGASHGGQTGPAQKFRVSIVKRRAYDPGGRGRRAVLSRATHPETTQT